MSVKLLRELKLRYPLLAHRAEVLNMRDNFIMDSEKPEGSSKKNSKKRKEKNDFAADKSSLKKKKY